MLESARHGGQYLLREQRTSIELTQEANPTTTTDLGAARIIQALLAEDFPGTAIVGESNFPEVIPLNAFVVDECDGTLNHASPARVRRLTASSIPPLYSGFWGPMIGYIENGVPLAGVMVFPALNIEVAADSDGCYVNGEKVLFDPDDHVFRALGADIFAREHERRFDRYYLSGQILREGVSIRVPFCCAVSTLSLLLGDIDAYIQPKWAKIWDLVAPAAVVLAAGGVAYSLFGEQPEFADYLGGGMLFAKNLWTAECCFYQRPGVPPEHQAEERRKFRLSQVPSPFMPLP